MKVAVGHSPEGRGHATRMLAVAERLDARGHEVVLAGGGPGERFATLAGYDEAPLTEVDFSGARGPIAVAAEVVRGVRRLRDAVGWLRREAPDRVVADDVFVAVAAVLVRVDCYLVTHTATGLFDGLRERVATLLANAVLGVLARDVLCPLIPGSDVPPPRRATTVPPIAMDGGWAESSREDDGAVATDGAAPPPENVDVLVVPSAYSESLDGVVRRLEEEREVRVASGTERSLVPAIAAADAVVCAGYSTMMEAAVAGTPCVVVPASPEQRGVARALAGTSGFERATSPDAVADALAAVGEPKPAENGAGVVAEKVVG